MICTRGASTPRRSIQEENRKFYNTIQELKGSIRVFCRVRPLGRTGDSRWGWCHLWVLNGEAGAGRLWAHCGSRGRAACGLTVEAGSGQGAI